MMGRQIVQNYIICLEKGEERKAIPEMPVLGAKKRMLQFSEPSEHTFESYSNSCCKEFKSKYNVILFCLFFMQYILLICCYYY